jgi:hypothetical protein
MIGLDRKAAASYIRARLGFGSVSWLDKLAMTGKGPRYARPTGHAARYSIEDLNQFCIDKASELGRIAARGRALANEELDIEALRELRAPPEIEKLAIARG